MPARRERMMAGAGLPTSRYDSPAPPPPPRIAPRVPTVRFASEVESIPAAPEPVVVAAPVPVVAAAYVPPVVVEEPVVEAVAPEPVAVAPVIAEPVVEEPVVAAAVVAEPVAEEPVIAETPRQSFPVSSYYEAARQQAWQQPVERVESYEPALTVHEEPVPAPVDGHVYAPVIVEHIPADKGHAEEELQRVEEPVVPEPELVPVKASVFDDDFFRRPKEDLASVASHAPAPAATHWPEPKVPSFGGYAADTATETDEHELDIPAFLRRNH
jgi:hypothetical protein